MQRVCAAAGCVAEPLLCPQGVEAGLCGNGHKQGEQDLQAVGGGVIRPNLGQRVQGMGVAQWFFPTRLQDLKVCGPCLRKNRGGFPGFCILMNISFFLVFHCFWPGYGPFRP